MLADLKRPEVQGTIAIIQENFSGYEMKWRDEKEELIEAAEEKPIAKPKDSIPTNLTEIAGKKFVRREL